MATFTSNSQVFLPELGYGLRFSGFIAIAPPSTRQNAGRFVLLEIRSGSLVSQNLWDGQKLSTISAIANQDNYRLGYIPGSPDDLDRNLELLALDLRVSDRLVNLSGSVDVGALFGLSRPSVTVVLPPVIPGIDTTPPTVTPADAPAADITPPSVSPA